MNRLPLSQPDHNPTNVSVYRDHRQTVEPQSDAEPRPARSF